MNQVLSFIKKDCKINKVNLKLVKSFSTFADGDPVSGYFVEDPLKIRVAIKRRPKMEWIGDLAHEYSHFRQFKGQSKYWRQLNYSNGDNAYTIYTDYAVDKIRGVTKKKAKRALKRLLAMEHDCERKTIRLLKKVRGKKAEDFVTIYTKKANHYMLYIIFNFYHRHFKLADLQTSRQSLLMDAMPDKLMPIDYFFKNYKKYEALFQTVYIRK